MYMSSMEYVLPDLVQPRDLPSVLAGRKPNYALALGWSFLTPSEDGSFDRVSVHITLTDRFRIMGRPAVEQFDDATDAEALCETLGFDGAYISADDSASDLAERCLTKLQSHKNADSHGHYAAVIYTHATPEEDPNLTPSFRIQSATKDDLSLPFSVSGNCSASFVSAVQVAQTLLADSEDDRPILIVAADRFLPPVHSRIGSFTLFSDAASAVVIAPKPVDGGFRVMGTAMRNCFAVEFDWYAGQNAETMQETIAAETATLIQQVLADQGVSMGRVDAVAPQHVSQSLMCRIRALLPGLPEDASSAGPKGNFSTSSLPIALSSAAARLSPGDLVLGWCAGLDGTVATILAEKT